MVLGMSEELLPVLMPIAVYWLTSGIYHLLLSRKEEYRLFPKAEEETQNLATKRQVIVGVLVNQALQIALFTVTLTINGRKNADSVDAPPASLLLVAKQLALGVLVFDGWEYFWHRWMHESQLFYKHVHAMHHQLIVPYSYGAQYVHPVDGLMGEILGGIAVLYVTGMSPRVAAVFFSLATVKGVDDHCGHWFPGFNPFHRFMSNNAAFHTIHHQTRGLKHNYSIHFLSTWDLVFGTYLPYSVQERKGGGYEIRTVKDD